MKEADDARVLITAGTPAIVIMMVKR